jgi:predicted ATPase/DNA-binding SARP family transcriptional activator/class 3 adenylate cyclase
LNLPTGTVTFLFTDIEGSTKLAQDYRHVWEELRSRHHTILNKAIETHSGYIFQIIGDAFCAAFSTAEDAVHAALKAQIDLSAEKWMQGVSIKVRMGIHTGKAKIQKSGEYHGYLAMSRVQRIMAAAHGGQILLSLAAQNQVFDDLPENVTLRDMGEHQLKNIVQPEHIYQLIIPGIEADFPPLKTEASFKSKARMGLMVSFFGRFEIKFDNKPINLSSRIAQSLLAYLILNPGISHRREKLAGMFWPNETEERARAYLRHELWRLRKVLSTKSKTDFLYADDINISFDSSTDYWLDVAILKNDSGVSSIEALINALSLFHGEFLPGLYDDWVILEREHLQVVYEQRIARLLELLEKEKRWNDILEWAERWISLGQGPEAPYRYLMIAYDALEDRAKVASTYQRCVQSLRTLDIEPSEQTRALAYKRTSSLNIPVPLTSFIGREKELEEVAALLIKSRLVTLTGSGGVGKTRLSIQVVADVLDRFPDGVWFIDLAPLNEPTLVPHTLANVLGLRDPADPKLSITDLIKGYLRSRTALLIFDNCEHLIDACSLLVESLLQSCSNLHILTTSREAFRVAGEISYRVPSLEVPSTESVTEALVKTESVRLFGERAATIAPGFAIGSQNALVVAQICQRLDGIPLAIELAAARTNMLNPDQILKRLDDRFNLLTRGLRTSLPRHQTLRETIEWSYSLLSEREQLLFRRLAVFTGGWTLETAEEVCSGHGLESSDILDLLSRLVNKSLVLVEALEGEHRYRRLESIRQFAREKLFETTEAIQLQDRHLEYFLTLAETAEPHLRKTEQIEWLKRLDTEYDNLRAALAWAMGKPSGELALRLAGNLGSFWQLRMRYLEAAKWLDQALARTWNENNREAKAARAKALYRRADIAQEIDELDVMKTAPESALLLCEEVEDAWGTAYSRVLIAIYQMIFRTPSTSGIIIALLEKSLDEFQRLGDPWGEALALGWRAMIVLDTGKREEFLEIEQRVIARARASGDRERLAFYLAMGLANDPFDRSDWDEAERILQEAEQLYEEIDFSTGTNFVRSGRTEILFVRGEFEKAKAMAKLVIENWVRLGERNFQCRTIGLLALIAAAENDLPNAEAYAQKALDMAREIRIPAQIMWNLTLVGMFKYQRGQVDVALQYVRNGLEFVQKGEVSDSLILNILDILAGLLVEKKNPAAVQILAFTEFFTRSASVRRDPIFDKPYFDRFLSTARAKLNEAEFTSAWEMGGRMSLDEGIAYLLKELQ